MREIKITEQGWPGHFIGAWNCEFRRNTLIEFGNKRIVVSTVGAYKGLTGGIVKQTYDICEEIEMIGYKSYYETKAFKARWKDPYWDANWNEEVEFNNEWSLNEKDRASHLKANLMHDTVVKELASKFFVTKLTEKLIKQHIVTDEVKND